MKTHQLLVRSAVTIVATGLTLLTSNQSDAHGRGSGRMGMSGGHGGIARGAIEGMSGRTFMRTGAQIRMNGRNQIGSQAPRNAIRGTVRDDRGGHGERRHGRDDGRMQNTISRGERQPGDDRGHHRERGDDKGRGNSILRGEREPGDDHGRHQERNDDKGGVK